MDPKTSQRMSSSVVHEGNVLTNRSGAKKPHTTLRFLFASIYRMTPSDDPFGQPLPVQPSVVENQPAHRMGLDTPYIGAHTE